MCSLTAQLDGTDRLPNERRRTLNEVNRGEHNSFPYILGGFIYRINLALLLTDSNNTADQANTARLSQSQTSKKLCEPCAKVSLFRRPPSLTGNRKVGRSVYTPQQILTT